jgi:AsmA protein
MRPDADSLIRHSRATAPLLDALKRRKGQDAIRSAIEKFTGGSLLGLSDDADAKTPAPAGEAAPTTSLAPAGQQ